MNKKDIIDYVVDTPTNTNSAVLSTMLDSFQEGDNKEEIELTADENKVYTPETGKVYKKVTVNVPAPASDYSTAQVTLAYTGGGMVNNYISFPTIANDTMQGGTVESDGTYTVPLYKGSVVIPLGAATATVVSGDAEVVDDKDIVITGDCSLNVNN